MIDAIKTLLNAVTLKFNVIKNKMNDQDVKLSELFNITNNLKKRLILLDSVNGYNYVVEMQNGQLVSYCVTIKKISLTTPPTKILYYLGESFDPTGMVITIEYADGRTEELIDYLYPNEVTSSPVICKYNDYSINIDVTVVATEFEKELIDFDYIIEEDGTYTITGWKGTLNGEPSTEITVPDSNLINI